MEQYTATQTSLTIRDTSCVRNLSFLFHYIFIELSEITTHSIWANKILHNIEQKSLICCDFLRQGSPADALMLAKKHEKHEWYIKIQIEDHQKYREVLDYIANLNFEEANHYTKKYGQVLVEHLPYESTQFLKRLCTNYKPENSPIVSENMISGSLQSGNLLEMLQNQFIGRKL